MRPSRLADEPDSREPGRSEPPAREQPTASPVGILGLQRSAGNHAVARMLQAQRRTVGRYTGLHTPPAGPAFRGNPNVEEPDDAMLPATGDAQITLTSGTRFPLAAPDLKELELGQGHLSTGPIEVGEGITARLDVGSHTPVRLATTEVEITPVVAHLAAGDIERQRTVSEAGKDSAELRGASAGALVGGALGVMAGPGAWFAGYDPFTTAAKGAELGGRAGAAVGGALFGDYWIDATLVSGALKAHLPLKYDPYITLGISGPIVDRVIALDTTLQTQLALDVQPFISLALSKVRLHFTDGRLARTEMSLNLEGGLEFLFNAFGQLRMGLKLLPTLEGAESEKGSDEGGLTEIDLVSTEVFPIIEGLEKRLSATAQLDLLKASPMQVKGKALEGEKDGVRKAAEDGFKKGGVGKRLKKAAQDWRDKDSPEHQARGSVAGDGELHAGTEADPVPMFWHKPPHIYPKSFRRMAGARPQIVRAFPHRWYPPDDLEAGVDGKWWPHKGKKLRKTGTDARGEAAAAWRDHAETHGLRLPPIDQIDHVQDIAFGGPDAFENLWPLEGALNEEAGRTQNLDQDVRYQPPGRKLSPGTVTKIRHVPPGTVFVIWEMILPPKR